MEDAPAVDRLATGAAVQVRRLRDESIGEGPVRAPHRHDYHELIWLRAGTGEHLIDGSVVPALAGTVTVIGRGQVHVFRHAEGLTGAVVRFSPEALAGGSERIVTGFLLAGGGGRVIAIPDGARGALEALIEALADEAERPPDAYSADVQRNLVATILLWLERFYDARRTERREADDAEVQLHRRFAARLETDFARHHDAAHYADVLGVPAGALSRALSSLTGRSTKELVLDRVMLEAARLLRFSDQGVGEVAWAVGYRDPLYFSRAFKRHFGEPPQAYRDRTR